MNNSETVTKHGAAPYSIAVLHGGPGAPGSVSSLCRMLSSHAGVLEPLQAASTVTGQIEELKAVLSENAVVPTTLIGWSWGAMLAYMFAARYGSYVKKLILVSGGPFEQRYADAVAETRFSRLSREQRQELDSIKQQLSDPSVVDKDPILAKMGELYSGTDDFDPLENDDNAPQCQFDIYNGVWSEAKQLRESGELLSMAKRISCPVVAIHGSFDSHPSDGVKVPLKRLITNFRFFLLDKCGHRPWIERQAKDEFFRLLKDEL